MKTRLTNQSLQRQTLNARGQKLSQADLIRNYFLMRVPSSDQERVYQTVWKPMEDALGENLSPFMRHFLSKDGELINQNNVYSRLRSVVAELRATSEVEAYGRDMSRFAGYYRTFLDPSREEDKAVRGSLNRFRKIQITVAYPFLLQLFEARFKKTASPETVRATLETVENFAMRRWVCGVQTYSLQNTFTPLWKESISYAQGNYDKLNEAVERYLCNKNYPHDEQFENDLTNRRLYADGEARDKLRVLLERLEDSFEHRERVSLENTSIEHVLPQSIVTSSWWQEHLGESWFDAHEKWLHTLGNLTLTGYNANLSNDDFNAKRKILTRSTSN